MTSGDQRARLQVSPRLREVMRYEKFARDAPQVMILASRYWLDAACARAATRLGWSVANVPVVMEGTMPREMLADLLEKLTAFRPDFVLTINLGGMDAGGLLPGLLEDLEIPLVAWFVDDPRTILMSSTVYRSPYSIALTWEPAYADYLRAAGFGAVHVLPLAADLTHFSPAAPQEAALPPSFVGSSMRAYAAREWAWLRERPALQQALLAAFSAGRVTRDRFGEGMHKVLGETFWNAQDAESQRHLELVCFIEGTRRIREELVKALAPEGLVVRGDNGWSELGIAGGPPLEYDTELPGWYRACTVNLNTTSLQMAGAVNQRVFDCPAAGGFLLTDRQSQLRELFELPECATYDSVEECRDKMKFYAQYPQARAVLIAAGQRRVLQAHTYEHRLQTLLGWLRAQFAG